MEQSGNVVQLSCVHSISVRKMIMTPLHFPATYICQILLNVFCAPIRYYLQGEDELDCNWLFMKGEEGGDGGWINWLGTVL